MYFCRRFCRFVDWLQLAERGDMDLNESEHLVQCLVERERYAEVKDVWARSGSTPQVR